MAQKWLFAPYHNSNTHRPYSRVYYQEQSSFVGIDKKRFHRLDEKTVVYGIDNVILVNIPKQDIRQFASYITMCIHL